ncbi:MAG: gamma carbonic anhydrase family protein [Leptospiraceae bacterium]|nr:gamma carbonic anhydrase family protein [Leptospiraceae bacterium]
MIYSLENKIPEIADTVFIAPNASVIGDVKIGTGSSVWFHCTIRGDVFPIQIGDNTNIQDNSVIHVTGGKHSVKIGNNVTIGHRCIVHGAELADYSFIGMGSIVMDAVKINPYGFVAAGALVPPGMEVPEYTLVAGIPAKVIRRIKPEEEEMIRRVAENYSLNGQQYRQSLVSVSR